MTIESEIARIRTAISQSYSIISAKGGEMPAQLNADNLADAIMTISGGGGDDPYFILTYKNNTTVTWDFMTGSQFVQAITNPQKLNTVAFGASAASGRQYSEWQGFQLVFNSNYPNNEDPSKCQMDSWIEMSTLLTFLASYPSAEENPTFYKDNDQWCFDHVAYGSRDTFYIGDDSQMYEQCGITIWGSEDGARIIIMQNVWVKGGGMEEGATMIISTEDMESTTGIQLKNMTFNDNDYFALTPTITVDDTVTDDSTANITTAEEIAWFCSQVTDDSESGDNPIIYPCEGGVTLVNSRYISKIEITDKFVEDYPVVSSNTINAQTFLAGQIQVQEIVLPEGFTIDFTNYEAPQHGPIYSALTFFPNLQKLTINTTFTPSNNNDILCVRSDVSTVTSLYGPGAQAWYNALHTGSQFRRRQIEVGQ